MIDIEILSLETNRTTGIVNKIIWNAYIVEDNRETDGSFFTAHSKEATLLVTNNSSSFIPLNEVNEAKAIEWINTYHDMQELQTRLLAQIEEYKNGPEEVGTLPWKNSEVES